MRIPIQAIREQLLNMGSAKFTGRQTDAMDNKQFGFASIRTLVLMGR